MISISYNHCLDFAACCRENTTLNDEFIITVIISADQCCKLATAGHWTPATNLGLGPSKIKVGGRFTSLSSELQRHVGLSQCAMRIRSRRRLRSLVTDGDDAGNDAMTKASFQKALAQAFEKDAASIGRGFFLFPFPFNRKRSRGLLRPWLRGLKKAPF